MACDEHTTAYLEHLINLGRASQVRVTTYPPGEVGTEEVLNGIYITARLPLGEDGLWVEQEYAGLDKAGATRVAYKVLQAWGDPLPMGVEPPPEG